MCPGLRRSLFTIRNNKSIINTQTAGERTHMSRKLIFLIFVLCAQFAFAQKAEDPKKNEEAEKLKVKAVEFLRETSSELGRMRSIENRISFSAELASLMWFHDEKEAKVMFGSTINDFNFLLGQYDAQVNMLQMPVDEDAAPSFLFGMPARSPVERKFRIALAVRQQIAMSVAEHDAELAYNFFYNSASLITNPKFRAEIEMSDKNFEFQLMKQIAETNATKAAKFATASIKNGIDGNHVELLRKIYAKDPDQGVEFGAAMLSRIRSDKESVHGLYVFSSLLSFGSENLQASLKPGGKKAIYSRNDLRDLADQFARVLLDGKDEDSQYSALGFVEQIDKFAPGRGSQIRAKYAKPSISSGMGSAVSNSANVMRIASASGPNSNTAANSGADERRQLAEKQLAEDMKKFGKELPKEERDKVVANARKIISTTPGKDRKIIALSGLAAQVAKAGDRELADQIMLDAERLINPQPKNYQDFLYTWMVSSGYAEANPDKAFPMIENLIYRANETISAVVKVAEFIDVNEEIVDDGEVQVGMFGGSMVRGMTTNVGIANSTLMSLAKADFAKTRALTNTFDRIEIRILAKMMILRAVLDDRKPPQIGPNDAIDVDDAPPPPMPVRPRP